MTVESTKKFTCHIVTFVVDRGSSSCRPVAPAAKITVFLSGLCSERGIFNYFFSQLVLSCFSLLEASVCFLSCSTSIMNCSPPPLLRPLPPPHRHTLKLKHTKAETAHLARQKEQRKDFLSSDKYPSSHLTVEQTQTHTHTH